MASVIPIAPQEGMVLHSCGESNPPDANFCGGCGSNLTQPPTCEACGRTATLGARFCQGCGARLLTQAAAAGLPDAGGEARLAALEGEVAAMRGEMEGLLVIKAQLDGAMQRIRQRGGSAGARSPFGAKTTSVRPAEPKTEASPSDEPKPEEPGSETSPDSAAKGDDPAASEGELQPDAQRRVAVIHVEDRPDLQDAVQATIACYKAASYHPESTLAEEIPEGQPLVVVNLLAAGDPLTVATDSRLSPKDARSFTYVTDGARGFVLGVTELFPPPFDPAACAARILALMPATPRVLVVSEAVLGTPELRAHLVRQGCTTSIAFDEKQALGLIPSVRPNLVLIDLNMPRGEGLRLAGRIRKDEHNRGTRIAFLWQQKIDPALFRQLATRASFDFRFSEEELRRFLLQEFNPGGAAYIDAR